MGDNNKAVGPLAAAKLVTLIKALTAKKYDKTGGKIDGSAEITGDVHAGGAVQSDLLLSAPSVAVHNGAGALVGINCSGDNAAGISSLGSDGKSRYSRFAVGTPTSADDAATKAYVDAKVDTTVYVDFWPTGSEDVYDKDFKAYVEEIAASQTFDAIFDSIKAGNKTIARFYSDESKTKLIASSVDVNISGDKSLGTINFSFLSAGASNVAGFSFIGEHITLIKTSSDTGIFIFAGATVLPVPNSDGTDDGKVPTVNGKKWELKTPPSTPTVDTAMSDTSTNAVQNKVIKKYVDDKVASAGSNGTVDAALSSTSTNPVQNKAVKAAIDAKADKTALDAKADKTALNAKLDKTGGTLTGNLTGKYFCGTWLQSTEASDLGRTPGKIAVLDGSGWVYYRTPAELFGDLGIANAIKSYVDTAIVAAINSAY